MTHNPYDVPTPPDPLDGKPSIITAGLIMLAILAFSAIVALLVAAPVPKPKDPPPPSLLGTWECTWGAWGDKWDGEMLFAKDGTYHHSYKNGSLWVGTWWRAGDGSLVVRERLISRDAANPPGRWMQWHCEEALTKDACLGVAGGDHGTVKWAMRNKKPEGK